MAKRILIADDSVTIQKALAMTFAGEDVAVTAARSADEAFSLAQKQRPDLIIADGAMPGRTGYDLCVQVRGDANLRSVPFYILASGQQPYDESRAQKSGVDGQLIKPWDTAAFVQQINAIGSVAGGVPTARRTTGSSIPVVTDDDGDYGEISIEASGPETTASASPPPAPVPAPVPIPRSPTPPLPAAPLGAPPGMRPSLIPGLRPGAVQPARPGTAPMRPLAPAAAAPAPPRPAAAPAVGRTMIGLPAAGAPIPGVARPAPTMPPIAPGAAPVLRAPFAPAPPAAPPAPNPVVPFTPPAPPPPRARAVTPTPTPVPVPRPRLATPAPVPPPPAPPPAVMPQAVAQSIDQRLAAISAKGPEYEAIAKLSREIIEQVVWEVVPDLAEAIIREHLEKRGRM
ncbi:MAG TPA: response regulator [Polyangia bacterium]|nr:response regulator [Polyangia bacterium]